MTMAVDLRKSRLEYLAQFLAAGRCLTCCSYCFGGCYHLHRHHYQGKDQTYKGIMKEEKLNIWSSSIALCALCISFSLD